MTMKIFRLDNRVLSNSTRKYESSYAVHISNNKPTVVIVEHFCNSNFSLFEPKLLSKLQRLSNFV
jgi:hypothetical protein